MQTLESLSRKLKGSEELNSIVRTMKAMAASNIGQYEKATEALGDYYDTVALGIVAYFNTNRIMKLKEQEGQNGHRKKLVCAIVFGSDQGFVGQFNDSLTSYVSGYLNEIPGTKEIWTVGARIPFLLEDAGQNVTKKFELPSAISTVTALIGSILLNVQERHEQGSLNEFYIFYNQSMQGALYGSRCQRLLPLDEQWRQELTLQKWPTKKIPQLLGKGKSNIEKLIEEFLFVTLYKACAESLASENRSRLAAMQLAEKNIGELLETIRHTYHRLRQSSIDEELFDVVSGFEALKNNA
jgi:F-type H+-transporting ATPase subunit gamma